MPGASPVPPSVRCWGMAGIAVLAVSLGVLVAFLILDRDGREERVAAAWLSRQPSVVPTRLIDSSEVSAPGLARLLIRPDGAMHPIHRWIWDRSPRWFRDRFGLPRPRDARWNGIMARAWLELHQQRNEALPILLAAATDPTRANHGSVMMCLRSFGLLNPWMGNGPPWGPVGEALIGLESTNPAVRLRMLQRFSGGWPDHPAIQRRVTELKREISHAEAPHGIPGNSLSTATNRGTVPSH